MKKSKILDRLNAFVSKEPSSWIEEAEQMLANRDWIQKSSKIAVRILQEIEAKSQLQKMSQSILAIKMGVSAQYINKIVKGQENLSLETICKLEKALGITLIEIPSFEASQTIRVDYKFQSFILKKTQARQVYNEKSEYQPYSDFIETDEIAA